MIICLAYEFRAGFNTSVAGRYRHRPNLPLSSPYQNHIPILRQVKKVVPVFDFRI